MSRSLHQRNLPACAPQSLATTIAWISTHTGPRTSRGVNQGQPADLDHRSAVFVGSPPAAHYNRAAPWSYPMSKADLALRHASIIEQWEAKRLADRDAADTWRLNEIAKLYETCGWTPDEIGAWFGDFMAKRISLWSRDDV
jgi:hypothetical protein